MTTMRNLTRTLVKEPPICVRDDDTIVRAAERLAREDVGALPVYDRDRLLGGMITDRDIVVNVVAAGKNPARTLVGEVASIDLVAIGADDTIEEAMRVMSERKVRRLLVIDGRECIGVISQADLARALPPEDTGKLVRSISRK